jgi:hypoxanthine phosphoribosyltransferase
MKLLYSQDQIHERIFAVAEEISRDYAGKDLLLVGVLKGCTIFMSHLLVKLKGAPEIDFMTVSSYSGGTESGELQLKKDLDGPVEGRHVLIVEDIVDTGKTVQFVREYLMDKGAASVEVVTFVDKEARREFNVLKPKYICFEYEGEPFVIGFGFDYMERYRNLPEVYQLEEEDRHK